ncbi:MAG: HAMP domain-containing protein, partial [Myxococcales bacterium]|nr:HAMP domain-containing protein [Myxococcales bacterium]
MKWTIGKKFMVAGVVVAVALSIPVVSTLLASTSSGRAARSVVDKAKHASSVTLGLAVMAEEAKLDVVQVQQFLSDISATRAAPGFADGLTLAEKQAVAFRGKLERFKATFSKAGDQAALASISAIGSAFEDYYALGKKLAAAYIKGGPEAGNKLMEGFDKKATAINKQVDKLVAEQVDKLKAAQTKIAGLAQQTAANASSALYAALAIVFVCLLAAVGFALIMRRVTGPLREASRVASHLANGDLSRHFEHESSDEVGDLARAFGQMVDAQREMARAASSLAKGDLDVAIKRRSDADTLAISLQSSVDAVRGLVDEVRSLAGAAVEGDLSRRGDGARFDGGFRDVIVGLNETLDALLAPHREATRVLEQ